MTVTYAPFIIAEDEALKALLQGVTVEDDKNANRAVGVWYGQPDLEIRDQVFPYLTINMIDVSEATERQMSGAQVQPWYVPAPDLLYDAVTYDDWTVPYPVPVNLDYQITSFARHPRHDRMILAQVLGSRLPLRFGRLDVRAITTVEGDDTTIDMTTRRLDMLGFTKRDTIEDDKRLFMNVFTIRVSSELPSPYVTRLHKRVATIGVGLGGYDDPHQVTDGPPSFTESFTITV